MKEKPKPPPINAKAETVAKLPMFRDAYKRRRCILPIDAFFEWKAILGQKVKQPFAIAMAAADLRRAHDRGERTCGRDPRPYARDPTAECL